MPGSREGAGAPGLSIFAAAAESPDRPGLVAGDRTYSYRELADRARSAVAWRRARSPDPRHPVALVARGDPSALAMLHGLLATAIPVVLLHPRLAEPERADLLAGVRAAWPVPGPDPVPLVPGDWTPEPTSGLDRDPIGDTDASGPAAVVFTSGTTGSPRAVVLSRRAFLASAAASAANLGWEPDDRWLLPLPVAHVGGLSIVTRCLAARRTVVLAGETEARSLVEAMERHGVTLASLVPTLLARILDLDPPVATPSRLRALLLGGAPASAGLLARAADRGWPVLTTYGMSEACSQVATQPPGTVNRGELGAGPPLPGVEVRIGDHDEIQLRGPTLFDGYLARPAARSADRPGVPPLDPTGAVPLDRPFLAGGWFPTGDAGRLDAGGNLHVLGRRTDRIVTGGENVDPVEVERALEALPGVREACVVGVPDDEWGEAVAAAVVADPGSELDLETIRSRLRARLAPFKAPRHLLVLDHLPRNALGKLDRPEVRKRLSS